MEIERKFLVTDLSKVDLSKYKPEHMVQDYLYKDEFTAIRKRKVEKNNQTIYKYTIKTMKTNISVNEIEQQITKEMYDNLCINNKYNTIEKLRYKIPYVDDLIIELDIFQGKFEGIVFAEIEFKDEEQAFNTKLPEWFGKDISKIITNSDMATQNIDTTLSMLK